MQKGIWCKADDDMQKWQIDDFIISISHLVFVHDPEFSLLFTQKWTHIKSDDE